MRRTRCISCGNSIMISSVRDPYLCVDCEDSLNTEIGKYEHLAAGEFR